MVQISENVAMLVDEYTTLVHESEIDSLNGEREVDIDSLQNALVECGEWTRQGADAIVQLARNYGTFVLRNALALAIALHLEDGELGH